MGCIPSKVMYAGWARIEMVPFPILGILTLGSENSHNLPRMG